MAESIFLVSGRPQASPDATHAHGSAHNDAPPSQAVQAGLRAELTPQQQALIIELAATVRTVRAHAAHLSATGPFATNFASYGLMIGPDGKQYAVSGESSLDTAPVSGDSKATIQKARVVGAAANAPSDPSSQDRAVSPVMDQVAELELAKAQQAAVPSLVTPAYGQKSVAEAEHLLSMTA